jgi:hypothetical protein
MMPVDEFLELACLHYGVRPGTAAWDPTFLDGPARWEAAWALLAAHPGLTRACFAAAVVAGDLEEVERALDADPGLARRQFGAEQWEPVLFVCFGRIEGVNSAAVLRRLIAAGADVQVHFSDGENRFTPLTGVLGEGEQPPRQTPPHALAQEMADLLLDAGAGPVDVQGLYNTALWADETKWLERLFARGGDWSPVLAPLLRLAVPRNHLRRAAWLLDHGAPPEDLAGEAARLGLKDMGALLARFGAVMPALSENEAYQVAVLAGDREAAESWIRRRPEFKQWATPLLVAAERGRVDVITMLASLGVSMDAEDEAHPGKRAVHAAAAQGQLAVVRQLIALGADIDATDGIFGATAIRWADYFGHEAVVRALVQAPER